MNTKRQTIWLVSMLSLMVVLSAYYLFTEDSTTSLQEVTDQALKGNDKAEELPEVKVTEVTTDSGEQPHKKSVIGQKEATAEKDKKMLEQVESQGVMKRGTIETKQMQRNEQLQQETERLMNEINTTTGEKMASAYDKMTKLEDQEAKISNLEAELQKQYRGAVITQDKGNYQVVVQSNKLEAKEAVDIIDKLMKNLHITQNKVSVEYATS